jgi:hypothetical protein
MTRPVDLTQARKSRKRKGAAGAPAIDQTAPGVTSGAIARVATAVIAPALPAAAVTDALFRDTIIAAAVEVGFDGRGLDGLKGYLRKIASEDRKTYLGVLAKLIAPEIATAARETVTKIERVIVQARG